MDMTSWVWDVKNLHELLTSKYTVKLLTQIGEGDQQQEALLLNWFVRYEPRDADGRGGNGTGTRSETCGGRPNGTELGLTDGKVEEAATLDRSRISAAEARGQGWTNIQEATTCLAHRMKDPKQSTCECVMTSSRKLEPCGLRTCQVEVTTLSVCTVVTKKTKHKIENTKTTTMWPEGSSKKESAVGFTSTPVHH